LQTFSVNLAKSIGKLIPDQMQGGMAVLVLSKLVDKAPHLLTCQNELVVEALEGRVPSGQIMTILIYWPKAALPDQVGLGVGTDLNDLVRTSM
jgi:hypothetical protein